jgi:hypothetical protein
MMDPTVTHRAPRRADLDWLRVAAFGLLTLYHVGMAFVTWDWHVKTRHPSHVIEPLMVLVNPWRLSLLFFVSGCATRFMSMRLSPGRLARSRLLRLGVPLLFGMLVIVPPQSWVQVREHGFAIGFPAFYARYLSFYEGYCDAKGCLILPTWNHLWFVAYLLVYTLGLLALGAACPGWLRAAANWLSARLSGPGALIWPMLWLVAARWVLAPYFEETHALVDDWYAHSVYAAMFLTGFAAAHQDGFWRAAVRLRRPALALALITACLWSSYVFAYAGDDVPPISVRRAMRLVYGVDQWAWILAILGFAHMHLRTGGPWLDYLTQGVFPFYIVHQTLIVLVEFWIKPLALNQAVEALILIIATAGGCWLTYEIVRRVRWLRPLFGLRLGERPQTVNCSVMIRSESP